MDGVQVKHICIGKVDELNKLQGSKYTQSNAEGIYKTVYGKLKQGKLVLFSGTGCQVAGLYGYLGKRKYPGRLITIDLICGGVPSRFLIDKFIECEPYQVRESYLSEQRNMAGLLVVSNITSRLWTIKALSMTIPMNVIL